MKTSVVNDFAYHSPAKSPALEGHIEIIPLSLSPSFE